VIQLIVSLLIGAVLLVSVGRFAFRRRVEGGSVALVRARQALNTLQGGLLPADLVARIFDRADLDYVEAESSPELRELFMEERKRVALLWVGRVRKQLVNLKKFHLGSSRFYARLNVGTELSLAFDFTRVLFACRMLELFVHLRGPYAAPRMVGAMAATATKVCNVSQDSLAFLTPAYAARGAEQSGRTTRV
jgi:hypothetical protein